MKPDSDNEKIVQLEAEINSLSGELLRAYQEVHTLYRLSDVMSIKTDLEDVTRGILDEVLRKVPARRSSVMLLEPGGEYLTVIASRGIPTEFGAHPSVRVDESTVGTVVNTGKPLLVNNLNDHPSLAERFRKRNYLSTSLLSVPLLVVPQTGIPEVIGTINLADTLNEKGYFTSNDQKLLTAAAAQAAMAIKKIFLVNDLKEMREQNCELAEMTDILFSHNNQLAELHKVGRKISESNSIEEVCNLIAAAAVDGFGAGKAALLLMNDETKELLVAGTSGLELSLGVNLGRRMDKSITEAFETGRVKYGKGSHGQLVLCGNSIHGWGLFPLKGRASKLGIFVVEIGEQDISDSIAILVNHAAMALDTLMLNERLQQEVAERTRAEAKLKVLSGMLPICCSCKKIRDDKGYWEQVEVYVHDHSEAEFSHGICPECMETLYGKEFCDNMRKMDHK